MALEITVNGNIRLLNNTSSVSDLISEMALTGKRIAIEVNGEIVPASQHNSHQLDAGDWVEIVGAIGGG